MKKLNINKNKYILQNSQKLLKLKNLLENSKTSPIISSAKYQVIQKTTEKQVDRVFSTKDKLPSELSKDFSLYLSLIQKPKPINLLFSIDQFLFEFSKKSYHQKKTGEFFQQLKERKKLSMFYGSLTQKQIINVFNKVKQNKGYFSKNVFSLFERRLDIVLYRSGITKTITEAQQLIKHKKIQVNQNIVNIPSFLLNPGDFISISPETGEILSNRLLKLLKTGSIKNHPKIFGDFYSKLKKTLDLPLCLPIKTNIKEYPENKVLPQSFYKQFQSKLVCNLLIQLVCARIKSRSFYDLKKKIFSQNCLKFPSNHTSMTNLVNLSPTNHLILLKWKSFSLKNRILKKEKKRPLFVNKNEQLTNFSQLQKLQNRTYPNDSSLQFWCQNSVKKNSILSIQNSGKNEFSKISNNGKLDKVSNYNKKNLTLYRNSFLIFLKYLENSPKFTTLLSLNIKKSLFKKPLESFSKDFNFRVIKPIHLEVSYDLLNVIYLYSPQRINFPFYIDLDLIHRSLR